MRNRLVRSVLAAALFAVATVGALCMHSDTEGDVRADSHWPSNVVNSEG